MASVLKRKGLGILSAIFAFCALLMVVAALATEYWVNTDLIIKKDTAKGNQTAKDGGNKHFGLFSGSATKNFGLGGRSRDFKGK